MLESFPLDDLVSWSHLELWCATRSIEIDKNFVWFITCGAVFVDSLLDIIVDAIKNSNFITAYVYDTEYAQLVYRMFSYTKQSGTFASKAKDVWFSWLIEHNRDVLTMFQKERFYRIMTALDNRFPVLLIKFYDIYKKELHQYDQEFAMWIFKRCKLKAQYYTKTEIFKQLYAAMEKDWMRMQNIVAFMK